MRESREDGQGATRRPGALRRLTSRRPAAPRTDSERIAAVAAEAHVPVEEVLRDVADFRLALETDMIIAAAAVDAESPEILADVLDEERLELATFHDRLLTRLADAAAEDELELRRARRRPARAGGWTARLAAAAAAAVAVYGGTQAAIIARPDTVRAGDSVAMQAADQRYADFSSAVHSESAVAVRQAAHELHETLETLIAEHADDPEVAQRAAQMLQAEIALLQINDPEGAQQVLAQARTLVKMLKQAAPEKVRATVAPLLDAAPTTRPSPKPKPSATASPTKSPSPSPSPSSSTRASQSADPDDGPPKLGTP